MSQKLSYKNEMENAMELVALQKNSIFIGQQVLYQGNPMSKTLSLVPKDRMIEVPVMEETQMGMSLGLAMAKNLVVTFYPRWNFLICAANQLINHVDKYEGMTGEKIHLIIRVARGSDTPLDPGHQHKSDFLQPIKDMCQNINFYDLKSADSILRNYRYAIANKGIYCFVEYPELYN